MAKNRISDQIKRARKAGRRKAVAAQKARAGLVKGSSFLAMARAAAGLPLSSCLVGDSLLDLGVGMLILVRRRSEFGFTVAGFLLDIYCQGVKDAMVREMDEQKLTSFIDAMAAGGSTPTPIEPACARKLVEGAVAYAESLGLAPHRDYHAAHMMFGSIDAGACETAYAFGRDGKPCLIPGPGDSPSKVRMILRTLDRSVGDGNYNYLIGDEF